MLDLRHKILESLVQEKGGTLFGGMKREQDHDVQDTLEQELEELKKEGTVCTKNERLLAWNVPVTK